MTTDGQIPIEKHYRSLLQEMHINVFVLPNQLDEISSCHPSFHCIMGANEIRMSNTEILFSLK